MVNLSSCSSIFVPFSCLISARSSKWDHGAYCKLPGGTWNCVPKLLISLILTPKTQPGTGGLVSTVFAAPVGRHVPAPCPGRR